MALFRALMYSHLNFAYFHAMEGTLGSLVDSLNSVDSMPEISRTCQSVELFSSQRKNR